MTEDELRAVIALPKDDPERFMTLYGSNTDSLSYRGAYTGRMSCAPTTLRGAQYLRWRFFHPFAADLAAVESTNS